MFKQYRRISILQVTIAILLVASICAVCLELGQKALAQNATTNRTGEAAGPQQLTTKGPLSLTNASKSPTAVGGGNITSPGTSGTAAAKNITAGMPSTSTSK
jgi:hypothetical protein